MHNFVVHSNESACRKGGRLGPEQVYKIVSIAGYLISKINQSLLNKPQCINLKGK